MTSKNWLLIAVVLAGSLLLVGAGIGLMLSAGGIPDRSVLLLDLHEELPEKAGSSVIDRLLGWRQATVFDVVRALDAASSDERVPAVLLRLSGPVCCALERFQEVRQALLRYREAGGHVAVMLERGSITEYYVASAADEIYLLPGGSLDLAGLVMLVPFLRDTLDTIGITAQFETSGEHKDSPQVYTEREMTPAMRANLQRILDGLHSEIRRAMAAERGLSVDVMQELMDRGSLTGSAAAEAGLVDGLAHADEVRERLDKAAGGHLEDLTLFDYLDALGPGWFARERRIALVHASGIILHGETVDSEWYGQVAGTVTLSRALREAREDDDVEAVILRIDSPGGSASASEVIWREVRRTRDVKPVIVTVGNYAASGGFYIAMGGDVVIALPTSITGSIGVYAGKFSFSELYDWLGVNWGLVKSAENADLFLDVEPWSDAQRAIIREQVMEIHGRFRQVVAEGRGMELQELDPLATGRAWTGGEALRLGLVDRLGGLHEAIQVARERAGLPADARVRVEIYPRPKGWMSGLAGGRARHGVSRGPVRMQSALREVALRERLAREGVTTYWPARLARP